jgi:hypothetical protein
MEKFKIALIKGHNAKSKGAAAFNGTQEYDWYGIVFPPMIALMPQFDVKIFDRNEGGIALAVKRAKEWGAIATIEGHFNWAAVNPTKHIENLCSSKLPKSVMLAKHIARDLENHYKIGLRHSEGAKIDPDRGGANVLLGVTYKIDYCVLLEPAFLNLDNAVSRKFIGKELEYAKVLAASLNSFFLKELNIREKQYQPIKWDPSIFIRKMDDIFLKDETTFPKLNDMKAIWPIAKEKILEVTK